MSHTLIGTNVAYGAASSGTAASPDLLIVGAIGAFGIDKTDSKFKLITDATADNFDRFTFYQNVGNGSIIQTENFLKKTTTYTRSAYRAGAGDTIYIGNNTVAGTIAVAPWVDTTKRLDYFIKIYEDIPGEYNYGQQYNVNAGMLMATATPAQIQAKIVADLTTKLAGVGTVTAVGSGSTLGVKIVFTDATKRYNVLVDGDIAGTPRTVQSGDLGSGTFAQLSVLEREDRIQRGDMYHDADFTRKLPSTLSAATQYAVYWLAGLNITADKTGQKGETTQDVYTWLAVPNGQAVDTSLTAVLEALINPVPAPAPTPAPTP